MTKLEQSARQALEALGLIHFAATGLDRRHRVRWFDDAVNEAKEAITALQEALADQAEQDPKELVPVLAGFDRSKYTKEQWDWCLEYLSITDYEPMMCDFEYGTHTFYEAVQASVQWYEDHTSDMHLKISRTVGKFDVRTKDLTNDEIDEIESEILMGGGEYIDVIRAVIAADREKNK